MQGATFITHRQEEFSKAFLGAIVTAAGFKFGSALLPDNDSVDVVIGASGPLGLVRSPRIDVQLKCMRGPAPSGDTFAFELPVKNYNDLCPPRSEFDSPRMLVVVRVPENPSEWLVSVADATEIRYRAFWLGLHGEPPSANQRSVRVRVPLRQELTPERLQALMERIAHGGEP